MGTEWLDFGAGEVLQVEGERELRRKKEGLGGFCVHGCLENGQIAQEMGDFRYKLRQPPLLLLLLLPLLGGPFRYGDGFVFKERRERSLSVFFFLF